ncbi:MAG: type II secretion protein ATPase [Rhodospirillales bacterium]|nr:type II secretion protein ATPase [Alphaproteobacteria bacterium]MCB1838708.1 type II secretion protein ATPase [Alphaproteobacteria bacterium]MCB9977644.1 type II secretion protein ATPase [Rhodospirillales bacterium]
MSEADNQATDILLPSAEVAVFSRDAETLKNAGEIRHDWRFARVSLDVLEGDVETSIQTYAEREAPDLLIIQTDDINDAFLERLDALSGYCSEGTAAVIIGPVNDVYLYRNLIDMGVSDYLVRPVQKEVLCDVIAKTLVNRLGVSGSRLIAFLGAKGGVGTSSIIQAMALGVSELWGQKTALIDASGGWSSLSVGMGFDPAGTLREISRMVDKGDENGLKRLFVEQGERLSIMAGGGDALLDPTISPDQYERFLDFLMVKSPVVLADLSGAEPVLKKLLISRANQIVLVATPTLTALRFARSLIKEVADLRGGDKNDVSLIINKTGMAKSYEVTPHEIQKALEVAPATSVPYLPALFLGHESNARQILSDKEGLEILKHSLLPVLKKTITVASDGYPDEKSEKKSGLLGSFLTKKK